MQQVNNCLKTAQLHLNIVMYRNNVRVALAVQHLAQHATSRYIAQHPCALQHNATTGITYTSSVVLAALGGQHCGNFGVIWLETLNKI